MRAAHAAAFGVMCAAAACLFPDVSDLEHPFETPDATTTDAGVDAKLDGTTTSDASDAAVSPCTSQHTFCDDFDHGALGGAWDSKQTSSGLALSSSAVTAPFALEATASNGDAPALVKHFDGANHTHVEFDAMVQSTGDVSNIEVDLVSFIMDDSPDPYDFTVLDMMRWQGESQIEQYLEQADGGSTGQDLAFAETFASWHHLALDFDFSKQTFTAAVDGVPVQSISLAPTLGETGYTVYLGVAYSDTTSSPWKIFIDDFTLDQE
jgi:hypothetical protein